jgi:hypothetical protein
MGMSGTKIICATVSIECTCKQAFLVDLGELDDFAACPACSDVCSVLLEAWEHWTDPEERPAKEDIAVGRLEEEPWPVMRPAVGYTSSGSLVRK